MPYVEHKAGSATGETLTIRERNTLGRFRHLGLMMYKDVEAYYCTDCSIIYNVTCANCGAKSIYSSHLSLGHTSDEIFEVERPLSVRKIYGMYWVTATCRKCDFSFRVLVR